MLRSFILAVVMFALGLLAARFRVSEVSDWVYGGTLLITLTVVAIQLLAGRRARSRKVEAIENHCTEIIAALQAAPRGAARDAAIEIAQQIASHVAETSALERQTGELAATAEPIQNPVLADRIVALRTASSRLSRGDGLSFWGHVLFYGTAAVVLWLILGLSPVLVVYALNRWQPMTDDQHPPERSAAATPGGGAAEDAGEADTWKSRFGMSGTLGDTFGAVNALFSALALAGAIYSIRLQTRELSLQREEMAMNRRELSRTAEAQIQSERSFELQTRLAAFQSLAEHHRYQRDHAGDDKLLEFRSKGRERAFARRVESALEDLEAYAAGARELPRARISLSDHPSRIGNLYNQFQELVQRYEDQRPTEAAAHEEFFRKVDQILLFLVEEVALLTVLNDQRNIGASYLYYAGDSINAAVKHEERIDADLGPERIREARMGYAYRAFDFTFGAIRSFQYPERFTMDLTTGGPDPESLLAMYRDFERSRAAQ